VTALQEQGHGRADRAAGHKQNLYVVSFSGAGEEPLADQESQEIIDKVADGSIGLNVDKDIA
jgi:hypothetical protein